MPTPNNETSSKEVSPRTPDKEKRPTKKYPFPDYPYLTMAKAKKIAKACGGTTLDVWGVKYGRFCIKRVKL